MAAAAEEVADKAAEKMKELNMSTEELSRFEKAFRDPEFMKLFSDYAKEIQDPKHREENETYLRQMENEGRVHPGSGPDTTLIVPEAAFVVKTRTKGAPNNKGRKINMKVFINVCSSDKVEEATCKKVVKSLSGGSDWRIPFTLSNPRDDMDKDGNACVAVDFIVNPHVVEKASSDKRFKELVARTAMDAVRDHRGITLTTDLSFPRIKYKGPGGAPSVQAIKKAAEPKSSSAQQGSPFAFPSTKPAITTPVAASVEQKQDNEACMRDRIVVMEDNAARPMLPAPEYTITHVVENTTLKDHWMDKTAEANSGSVASTRPTTLLLKITLAKLTSAAGVDLNVAPHSVDIRAPGYATARIDLPYQVDDARGHAKFDKSKRVMTVTLPVTKPTPPPPKAFEEPAQSREEAEGIGASNVCQEEQPPATVVAQQEEKCALEGEHKDVNSHAVGSRHELLASITDTVEHNDDCSQAVLEASGAASVVSESGSEEANAKTMPQANSIGLEPEPEPEKPSGTCKSSSCPEAWSPSIALQSAERNTSEQQPVIVLERQEPQREEKEKKTQLVKPRLTAASVFDLD
eukprot:jgi/Chlat1/4306/Chrsp29S04476